VTVLQKCCTAFRITLKRGGASGFDTFWGGVVPAPFFKSCDMRYFFVSFVHRGWFGQAKFGRFGWIKEGYPVVSDLEDHLERTKKVRRPIILSVVEMKKEDFNEAFKK